MKRTADADRALKMLEKHKPSYGYYYDDRYLSTPPRCGKSWAQELRQRQLNCSDEICPGSNRRTEKIWQIVTTKLYINDGNFAEKYGRLIHQLNELLVEETMGLLDCTENEAKVWVATHLELNHVRKHEYDGETYLTIDPKVTPPDKSLKNSKKSQ